MERGAKSKEQRARRKEQGAKLESPQNQCNLKICVINREANLNSHTIKPNK